MTIYEIDNRLRELELELSECFDEETGEIIDEDRVNLVMDAINRLDIERDSKIEGALLMRQEYLQEAESLSNEIKRLTAMKKKKERRAESLKNYAQMTLAGEKFRTDKISVYYRKSDVVHITDVNAIPDDYVKVKKEPMKVEIKKAVRSGKKIDGAMVIENTNMIIK